MKFYVVLVTGGEYFLTPCVIIMAKDEDTAKHELKQNNRDAFTRYSIALDRISKDELQPYLDEGVQIAENAEDIAYAF